MDYVMEFFKVLFAVFALLGIGVAGGAAWMLLVHLLGGSKHEDEAW